MRFLSGVVGCVLATLFISGCVTSKVNLDEGVETAEIVPGKVVYHFADGTTQTETAPREAKWVWKNHSLTHADAGVPQEAEIGWDVFGIQPRPFAGVRVFYLGDFGGMVGADDNAFISGLDWRYKDLLVGPLVGVPWLDPSKTIWGGKLAVPFNF